MSSSAGPLTATDERLLPPLCSVTLCKMGPTSMSWCPHTCVKQVKKSICLLEGREEREDKNAFFKVCMLLYCELIHVMGVQYQHGSIISIKQRVTNIRCLPTLGLRSERQRRISTLPRQFTVAMFPSKTLPETLGFFSSLL